LLLYVDDIVLTASSASLLKQIIGALQHEFVMTDMGPLHHFLGISVTRYASGLFLSQRQYSQDILERARMSECKPCSTPVDVHSKLYADGSPVADPTQYRSLAGALQDLTFTVRILLLLFSKCASTCMTPGSLTLRLSSGLYGTYEAIFHLV
jgi:hypothetical protein